MRLPNPCRPPTSQGMSEPPARETHFLRMTAPPHFPAIAFSTDTWGLLPHHHVDDPGPPDACPHDHHARVATHPLQNFRAITPSDDGNEFAFVGHVKGVDAQDLAGPLNIFPDRD